MVIINDQEYPMVFHDQVFVVLYMSHDVLLQYFDVVCLMIAEMKIEIIKYL